MNKKIAYVTDIHLDEQQPKDFGVDALKNWSRILNDIDTRKVDEVIFGGDIGEVSANGFFFDSVSNYKVKITLGNHDKYSEATKYYSNEFIKEHTELYYSYSDEVYKYIYLDSSSNEISLVQLQWFADQLKADRKIILFVHHPILKVNTVVDVLYPLKNRDAVKDLLLEATRTVTIFCGHYHTEDYTEIGNIAQYVTPAASYQIKKGTEEVEPDATHFGYRMIHLTENKITTELILFDAK